MTNRISMSRARAQFAAVLAAAERGQVVEVTHNGRTVAAVVSMSVVERAAGRSVDVGEAYRRWRATTTPAALAGTDPFKKLRGRSPGRPVRL